MKSTIRAILTALLLAQSANAEVEIAANARQAKPCDEVSFTAIGAPEDAILEWEIAGPRIFANGFESGNLDAWDATRARQEKTASWRANPFVWIVPIDAEAGSYWPRLRFNSTDGPYVQGPKVTVVESPEPTFLFGPRVGWIDGTQIGVRALTEGAGAWRWDWGDLTSTGWLTEAQNPFEAMHTYARGGTYEVRLGIRGCSGATLWKSTGPFVIEDEPEPELAVVRFEADCPLGVCVFSPGQAVSFELEIVGSTPSLYVYDWNGDGQIDQSSLVRVSSRAFEAGCYPVVIGIFTDKGQASAELQNGPLRVGVLSCD